MNEDFFNYRQRENIRAICFALALIMLFVGFAWCAIRTESLKRQLEQKPNSTAPGKTDSVTADTLVVSNAEKEQDRLYPMPANLSFTTVTLASNDTSYRATVRIQATILPVDASNKSVDWTVAWSGTATRKAENVNDYVEAVPVADGSCIADVTCKKPFGNDAIIITVTTRDGNKTATCTARYLGHPTQISINTGEITVGHDSQWNTTLGAVFSEKSYTFGIDLNNEFESIPSSFSPSYTLDMTAHGAVLTEKKLYDTSGALSSTTEESHTPSICVTDATTYAQVQLMNSLYHPISVKIVDGKLVVEIGESPSTYTAETGSRTGRVTEAFKAYEDGKPLYFTITVTETTTGIKASINLAIYSSVSEVQLTPTEIGF